MADGKLLFSGIASKLCSCDPSLTNVMNHKDSHREQYAEFKAVEEKRGRR